MKKPLSAIMACGAMFTAMPLMAKTQVVDGITWTYDIDDNRQATVGSLTEPKNAIPTSTVGAIVIPSKLGGCPVVGIGDHAFYVAYKNKSKVKNLTALDGKTVTLYAVWRKS